jgi:hypothetical protein
MRPAGRVIIFCSPEERPMKVQSFVMKRTKDIANIPTPRSAPHLDPPDERAAAGKVLRDKIPRHQHGEWNSVQGRPNPIDLLHKSGAGRMKKLVPIRYGGCSNPTHRRPEVSLPVNCGWPPVLSS